MNRQITGDESGFRLLERADLEDLRHSLRISVWVRWFVVLAWLAQLHYRVNFDHPAYPYHMAFAIASMALNGYVHYRIESGRPVTWRWALALSAMDAAMLTGRLADLRRIRQQFLRAVLRRARHVRRGVHVFQGQLRGRYGGGYRVRRRQACQWGTAWISASREEKVLFMRIVVMYAVVAAVNLVSRFERIRRRQAVERERELQRERVELSQTIHNTIAQSAYAIGLGLETAIELAKSGNDDKSRDELVDKLQAIYDVSKSTMWELRHPIDIGPMFEGRELSRALRSHASTFAALASIPTEMIQSGDEPQLSSATRRLLFSIAHNALTNALRHSDADKVTVPLNFDPDEVRLSVSDDGVGLPGDYAERGHGFRNMTADAERMGGSLSVSSGESGRGAVVTCAVPLR